MMGKILAIIGAIFLVPIIVLSWYHDIIQMGGMGRFLIVNAVVLAAWGGWYLWDKLTGGK